MPTPVKDPHSGAILFQPTEEEKRIQKLEGEVVALRNEVGQLTSLVKELLTIMGGR